MGECQYTPERAKVLTNLNIPEFDLQISTKVLWLDIMSYDEIGDNHASMDIHSHSFFELIFPLSGKMHYEYDGKTAVLSKKDAILIAPSVPHRFIKCSKDSIKVSIAFSLKKNGDKADVLDSTDSKVLSLPELACENINYILTQLESKSLFLPSIIGGRLLEIINSALGMTDIVLPQLSDKMIDSRVLVAKSFIKNNHHLIIKCEDVAKECCLSTKQLSRIFKKHMGISISEYIASSKINYAKHLLLQSDKSIKEISFLLGFENESGFVSFFKRRVGTAPGKFRKQG